MDRLAKITHIFMIFAELMNVSTDILNTFIFYKCFDNKIFGKFYEYLIFILVLFLLKA